MVICSNENPKRLEGTSRILDAALRVRSIPFRGPGRGRDIMANSHMRFCVSWVFDTELQAHPVVLMRDTG